MKKRFLAFTMLLVSIVVLVACSSSGDDTPDQPQPQPQPQPQVYTVTSEATRSNLTRSTIDESSFELKWASSDVVHVKNITEGRTGTGTMTPQTVGSPTTTLRGALTGEFAVGDELEMNTLAESGNFSYVNQKGTLADIGARFAYATATVRVSSINGASVTTSSASFSSQQAIVKFTLLGETGEALTATSFTVEGCGTDVTVSGFTSSEVYVAMPGIDNGWMKLTATVGSATYSYETGHITYQNGKHYTTTVRMAKNESYTATGQPLTIQALRDDTKVTFRNQAAGKVEYSMNGRDWTDIAANSNGVVTLSKAGDKVYFKGANVSYYPSGTPSKISFDKACYVYGDIMKLANGVSLGDYAFMKLFEGETDLRSHPTKRLALTATTLTKKCYESMFSGCTGMLKGPEFAIPSTYPSTGTDEKDCYANMFSGCSSLNYVEYLGAYESNCFSNWLTGVAANGTFVTSSTNKSVWETNQKNSSGIVPSNWTIEGK